MDGTPRMDYRLSRFIPLPENQIAHHAVLRLVGRMAMDPGDVTNLLPLYVYGPVGCGKSHLLRALAGEILEQHPGTRLTIIDSEGPRLPLEASSQEPQVVLIEDLHRRREPAIQDEDLVRLLEGCGPSRIVLISSQSLPQRLEHLSGRVVSRVLRGLVIGISEPGPASRVRLLLEFAARLQLPLNLAMLEPMGDELLYRLPASIRRLEALAVFLQQTEEGRTRPLDALVQLLQSYIDDWPQHRLSRILKPVAQAFHVHPSALRSAGRDRRLRRPRQLAMYLTRERTRLPLKRIGQFFGGRDHATVLHACRKIEHDAAGDPALAGLLRELRSRMTEC